MAAIACCCDRDDRNESELGDAVYWKTFRSGAIGNVPNP